MRALIDSRARQGPPLPRAWAAINAAIAASVVLMVAGCGRVGFSALQSADADDSNDASIADANSDAAGWWNPAWAARRKIRFRNAARSEAFDGLPVAISLPQQLVDAALPSLDDVRFIDADGITELPFEIERAGTGAPPTLWLRVPRIDAATDQDYVWLYYGNANPGGPGANPTAVWDSSYVLVQHFAMGSTVASNVSFLSLATLNFSSGPGLFGGDAARFNGSGYLRVTDAPVLHPATMTITAWARNDAVAGAAALIARSNSAIPTSNDFGLFAESGQCTIEYLRGTSPFAATIGCATDATLHMHALVFDSTATRAYADGISLLDISKSSALAQSPRPITIGADINDGSATPNVGFWRGNIDEVRVANVARSEAWLDAELAIGQGTFVVVE